MGTYEKKVNQLKDLMVRKYKSAYNKSKEMDIDISSMTYLPEPDVFNVMYTEHMSVILDRVNKIIYDTIMMIGDASGKEGQFSDSDKKTAKNFGCEYMDVDDFVYKYNNR